MSSKGQGKQKVAPSRYSKALSSAVLPMLSILCFLCAYMNAHRHLGGEIKPQLAGQQCWTRQGCCCPLLAWPPAVRTWMVPQVLLRVGFQLQRNPGDMLCPLPGEFLEVFCSSRCSVILQALINGLLKIVLVSFQP